jgi:hypothetical protein
MHAGMRKVVIAGLDPAIHRAKRTFEILMDARVPFVRTRFALLPAHDDLNMGYR